MSVSVSAFETSGSLCRSFLPLRAPPHLESKNIARFHLGPKIVNSISRDGMQIRLRHMNGNPLTAITTTMQMASLPLRNDVAYLE